MPYWVYGRGKGNLGAYRHHMKLSWPKSRFLNSILNESASVKPWNRGITMLRSEVDCSQDWYLEMQVIATLI